MDWQLTCRVCLETGDMVSLFDWDENNEQLGDKYAYCCGVEVSKDDSLPTLICLNCVDRLTYACQFKKQCLSSNETLKECLDEFFKTSQAVSASKNEEASETETITIKQENGLLLQYELPVEHDPHNTWRAANKTASSTVVTKAPGQKKRGRPRKYPNEQGKIDLSPYQRKKPKQEVKEPEALTTLLANDSLELKQEPEDEYTEDYDGGSADDPDFAPGADDADSDTEVKKVAPTPKKRGRPRKKLLESLKPKEEEGEDMLLKETIMAFSEPIPDHILNPKPKIRKPRPKKKYVYEKTHVCETCGASFTSNASLQAHIRRHLGIKPFVCRLHMGLRPYQCALCGKSFTYSYVLANHMLTHTGEKKYACTPCNKKFTKAHHLKYHNKVHHKDIYIQQQLEQEAKKIKQQLTVNNLTGVVTGQIVDGQLQLIQTTSEGESRL
ncbi:uncharacterized protein [Maniola hyperantus]|uniref:uncharacterized protein isoform X4 n=1 Tax=Aphantopus hyperantus TaxID=2795564 RepID=UPI00374A52E8